MPGVNHRYILQENTESPGAFLTVSTKIGNRPLNFRFGRRRVKVH
jgi:hypothetical protein